MYGILTYLPFEQTSGSKTISHIIIDGYNVIGIFHKDMEKAREEFISLLIRYRKISLHDITVVFDGHKGGSGVEQSEVRGGVKAIYSRLAERADDVIKRMLSSENREWIMVSSDRDIANHAWAVNSIPIHSDRFLDIVSRRVGKALNGNETTLPSESENEDEDYDNRRGNPRRMSKKDKAVIRALGKL